MVTLADIAGAFDSFGVMGIFLLTFPLCLQVLLLWDFGNGLQQLVIEEYKLKVKKCVSRIIVLNFISGIILIFAQNNIFYIVIGNAILIVIYIYNLLKIHKYMKDITVETKKQTQVIPICVILSSLLVLGIGIPVTMFYSSQDKIEVIKFVNTYDDLKINNIRNIMEGKGFPTDVLNDLLPEEILEYEGLYKVDIKKENTYLEGAKAKLEVTCVISYLDNQLENNLVRTLIYIKWLDKPKGRYTDLIQIRKSKNLQWYTGNNEFQGVCIYDEENTDVANKKYYKTYECPQGTALTNVNLNGPFYNLLFKVPIKGENYRYYFGNTFELTSDTSSIWISGIYCHRNELWRYPYIDSFDYLRKGNGGQYGFVLIFDRGEEHEENME